MFDGMSGMDWLVVLAALALGFGLVKFMISQRVGEKPSDPSVPSLQPLELTDSGQLNDAGQVVGGGCAAVVETGLPLLGEHQALSKPLELIASGPSKGNAAAGRRKWFEILCVPESADSGEVEKAAKAQQALSGPDSMRDMLLQLRAMREAVSGSGSAIEARVVDVEKQLNDLEPLLLERTREIEQARIEGLEQLRQKVARQQ